MKYISHAGRRKRRAGGRRSGVAALEFALAAPVLTIFLMGMVDLADAIITLHKLNAVAQQTGLVATELAIQPDQSTTLTVSQLNEASSIIFSVFPGLASVPIYNAKTNPVPPYAVVVSDIVFTTTATGCTPGLTCTGYTANLAWSVPLQYGQQINRSCGTTINQWAATKAMTYSNNLPAAITTAGVTNALTSALMVDITYTFTPIFAKFLGQVTMHQTGYFNQRSITTAAKYITYNTSGAAALGAGTGGVICTTQGYV